MNFAGGSRRPVAAAMDTIAATLRGKYGNRYGATKGATPITAKRGPRDFYKGKGAPSTGRLTSKGTRHPAPPHPAPLGAQAGPVQPHRFSCPPISGALTRLMREQATSSSRRRSSRSSWSLTSPAAM